jgi:hypothetical protein
MDRKNGERDSIINEDDGESTSSNKFDLSVGRLGLILICLLGAGTGYRIQHPIRV